MPGARIFTGIPLAEPAAEHRRLGGAHMKQWLRRHDSLPLWLAAALAAVLFAILYWQSAGAHLFPEGRDIPSEPPESAPLGENKDIYQLDTNLYDVYISVLPTVDENGDTLNFSAFALHTARDHSYNPTLNCNIQILPEGQTPDPLLNLNRENATIRVRGNTARGAPYKNYKVRLDPGAGDFFGQTVLNINKDYYDISKVGTKLSTDLLAEIDGLAGYRSYFMRLWIRDASLPLEDQKFEYQGLHIELEQPNKAYLRARGLSEAGSLYKARNFAFRPDPALCDVDDPEYSEEAFEQVLGIREGGSHQKLLEMLEAVNDTSRDFEEVFAQYFNEDNYLTWLAFCMLLGHEDILNQNFLLYSPENSRTWYFINYDFDGCLRFGPFESKQPDSLRGIQRLAMVSLHRRFFQEVPGGLEKLDAKMRELLDTHITRERVTALVEAYRPILEKTLVLNPDLRILRSPPDQQSAYLDSLYDGILHNYDMFKLSSQYPLSGFVAIPEREQNGAVRFAWDAFYSLKGLPITYSVRVCSDYDMENLVWEADGLRETSCLLEEGLPDGTYYVLVSGTDAEGREQISLEHVEGWEDSVRYKRPGLLEFTLEHQPAPG